MNSDSNGDSNSGSADFLAEITRLVATDTTCGEFLSNFLKLASPAIGARHSVVWLVDAGGCTRIEYAWHRSSREDGSKCLPNLDADVLNRVTESRDAIMLPLQADGASGKECFVALLAPIVIENDVLAILGFLKRRSKRIQRAKSQLHFLIRLCAFATEFLRERRSIQRQPQQELLGNWDDFVRSAHGSLDPIPLAYTIANDGQTLIGCDRLSVALPHRSRWQLVAMSGQEMVDRRADVVRSLECLIDTVCRTRHPLWAYEGTCDLPPQIERPLNDYIDQSHVQTVAVIPLLANTPHIVGALVAEHFRKSEVPIGFRERLNLVALHATIAFENSAHHHNIFLLPLWKWLGRLWRSISGELRWRGLAWAALFIVGCAAFIFTPAQLKVSASGTLWPVQRSHLFAPCEGVVQDVLVVHGQQVQKGQVLARMRNHQLEIELTNIVGKRLEAEREATKLRAALLGAQTGSDREKQKLRLLELETLISSWRDQESILTQTIDEMLIESPIPGVVTTWDVQELMSARPVSRGDVLCTIADAHGEWELELAVPENDIAPLFAAHGDKRQAVSFVFAADPRTSFHGTVAEIAQSCELDDDSGENIVTVRCRFDRSNIPTEVLKPGSRVIARINCGRYGLAYTWLYRTSNWLQREILFYL